MDDISKTQEFSINNKSVSERTNILETFLDNYDTKVGISNIKYNNTAKQFLELSYEELNSYDEEECCIAAYGLEQYALFLQKEINRNQAKCNWASENIVKVIGKVGNNYGDKWTKYEMRRAMVIEDNEYANALNTLLMEMSIKVTELAFLSKNVTSMSNTLKSLARSKQKV